MALRLPAPPPGGPIRAAPLGLPPTETNPRMAPICPVAPNSSGVAGWKPAPLPEATLAPPPVRMRPLPHSASPPDDRGTLVGQAADLVHQFGDGLYLLDLPHLRDLVGDAEDQARGEHVHHPARELHRLGQREVLQEVDRRQ